MPGLRPGLELTKPQERNSNAPSDEPRRQVSENNGEQVQTLVGNVE
jgi:hypothetical protein